MKPKLRSNGHEKWESRLIVGGTRKRREKSDSEEGLKVTWAKEMKWIKSSPGDKTQQLT